MLAQLFYTGKTLYIIQTSLQNDIEKQKEYYHQVKKVFKAYFML